jgi:hypothetical protein
MKKLTPQQTELLTKLNDTLDFALSDIDELNKIMVEPVLTTWMMDLEAMKHRINNALNNDPLWQQLGL